MTIGCMGRFFSRHRLYESVSLHLHIDFTGIAPQINFEFLYDMPTHVGHLVPSQGKTEMIQNSK